jgi:hypothetical protein
MPVRGIVLDPAGTPVANATVAVRPAAAIRSRMYVRWRDDLTTDARGEFALRVPCERVSVVAHAPPFAPCASFLNAGEATCTFRLSRQGEPFDGIVRDWEGGPVEGARVFAMFGSLTLETVTDATGEFRLGGLPKDPAERVTIVVTAAGYDAVEEGLLDCRFASREFRLAAKPMLKATFLDCETSPPVAHTSVFLNGASLGLRTDGAGTVCFREPDFRYVFWDRPYPRQQLRPWRYSGRSLFPGPATTRSVDLGILRVRKAVVLDVCFLVVDGDGHPIAGASIESNGRCLTTDRDGRAVLCDAEGEDLSSVEVAKGALRATLSSRPDPWGWMGRSVLAIDITPADVAAGKKTVRVTLEPRAPDLPPVDVQSEESGANTAPSMTFDQIKDLDAEEDRERTVWGVVSTADGRPAMGALVEYRTAALEPSSWQFVSRDPSTAAFKFATRDAATIDIRATRGCARSEAVRIEAGTSGVEGVELRLPRTITAAVRVVPPEPWLTDFISVDLSIGEYPSEMRSRLWSRTDVRFALPEAFGSAHFSVTCPGCEARAIDFSTVAELPRELGLVRSDACIFRESRAAREGNAS